MNLQGYISINLTKRSVGFRYSLYVVKKAAKNKSSIKYERNQEPLEYPYTSRRSSNKSNHQSKQMQLQGTMVRTLDGCQKFSVISSRLSGSLHSLHLL